MLAAAWRIGSRTLKGYVESEWDAALDDAGYPRTAPPGMKARAGKGEPARSPAR